MQAIAEALTAQGRSSDQLRFVGSKRGQEATLLARSPIELTLLSGRGIQRSLAINAMWSNVLAVGGLTWALLRSVVLLRRWQPGAVVSVGGYASLAVNVAAVLTRTPLVLVDLDAVASGSHRVVARFAQRRCVAYPSLEPRSTVTGAPLRREISTIDRSSAKIEQLGASSATRQRWTIVVMTGSLGAHSVNIAVSELAQQWRARSDLRIVHVTGRRDFRALCERNSLSNADELDYELVEFADMPALWSVADLAICRAGATTLAELTHLGIASILIPLPGAPHDHQTANAQCVSSVGGAVVVPDAQLNCGDLGELVNALLGDPERLVAMGRGARTLRHEDASGEIAVVVNEVAR